MPYIGPQPTGVSTFGANVPLLSNSNTWSGVQTTSSAVVNPPIPIYSSGQQVALDLSHGNNYAITMTENTTFQNPTNMVAGQEGFIVITQGSATAYSAAFGTQWKFIGGTLPSLTSISNGVDLLSYYVQNSGAIVATITNSYISPATPVKIGKLFAIGGINSGGLMGQNNTINYSSPVQIGTATNWSQVSIGSQFSLSLNALGQLFGCGTNTGGQLGQNNIINYSNPVQIGTSTNWTQIASLSAQSLAINSSGQLFAWGTGIRGGLGQNNVLNYSSPVQIGTLSTWSQIIPGTQSVLALNTSGQLFAWGYNFGGQLGTNNIISYSSPVQIGTLSTWTKISSGISHTLALNTSGQLFAWGYNVGGQLGTNNIISYSSPVQIGTLSNWSQISTGNQSSLAINTSGQLFAWGTNDRGQLGQNNILYYSSPVQIGTASNWTQVSAMNGTRTMLAINNSGQLFGWGYNGQGNLGLNNIIHYSSPVQIGTLSSWIKPQKSTQSATFAIRF